MSSSFATVITPPPRSSSLRRPARAGWMSKLSTPGITNKPRWHPRFFVLVDTELRCYRNQHTDTPSFVIQLLDTCLVVPVAARRMNCFRLEPVVMSQPGSGNLRPLTLACESAKELADWVGAIQLRQDYPSRGSAMPAKLSVHAERPSPPPGATTLTRAFTAPTNKPTMTIMQRRRGGGSGPLSPLLVHPLDRSATMTARVGANPCSSSSSPPSPSSPLSSPSTITLSPTSPPIIVTPYCKANPVYITAQTTQAVTTVVGTPDSHTCSSSRLFAPEATKNDMSTDAYSPTYLQYKKQFRL